MNQQWVLRRRPKGEISLGDLELVETPMPSLSQGQALIRNVYLSIDPTNRIWMSDQEQYMAPVALGSPMRGAVVGVVELSKSDRLKVGELVTLGLAEWEKFTVMHEDRGVRPLHRVAGMKLIDQLSVLGGTGLTAYFGMTEIGRPKPAETVVVSAGAGAVGSIAGQIARIKGARVVGIAGGAAKCAWLTDELGFDGAVDYKRSGWTAALDQLCPDGIDVDFENVGGEIMHEVFSRMNDFGRIAVCGLISSYNTDAPLIVSDFRRVLMRRLHIQGFIISDYLPRAAGAVSDLAAWIDQGRIKWRVHVIDGLEHAAEALLRLFSGDHLGKIFVRISPEP